VGCHIAIPYTPLGTGIREGDAIFAGGEISDFLAAFTRLNDGMAVATIKLAAFLVHE
jgi:hypothetical protein